MAVDRCYGAQSCPPCTPRAHVVLKALPLEAQLLERGAACAGSGSASCENPVFEVGHYSCSQHSTMVAQAEPPGTCLNNCPHSPCSTCSGTHSFSSAPRPSAAIRVRRLPISGTCTSHSPASCTQRARVQNVCERVFARVAAVAARTGQCTSCASQHARCLPACAAWAAWTRLGGARSAAWHLQSLGW